jgi:2-polyprenyl-3-methyl-5-hydroxy-6-metoxy-1,4-benzoquinol methylase
MRDEHKSRYFISWRMDEATEKTVAHTKAARIPIAFLRKAVEDMGFHHPSSGAIAATYFLEQGHEVWLWGFDFLVRRRAHHYNNDGQPRGEFHDDHSEWLFFHRLMEQGRVKYFAHDYAKESIPIVRQPVPCGKDEDIGWYRESAHEGWYRFFGDFVPGLTVLDVGAGLCKGMKVLEEYGAKVTGFEVDKRLSPLHTKLVIGDNLSCFKDKSFDAITCVDVIEHVVEDVAFMREMERIAKRFIFVTTPCHTRSMCGNIAHCREYSIAQYMNHFRPSEIWSGSPDGTIHHTKVLTRRGGYIIDHSAEGPDNKINANALVAYVNKVPLHTRFNSTVDGEEWAHICAIHDLEEGR